MAAKKVVDLKGPMAKKETVAMIARFKEASNAPSAFVELLGGVYANAAPLGYVADHAEVLYDVVNDIKLDAWKARNKFAKLDNNKDAPQPRRNDKTTLRRVIAAGEMRSATFWETLVSLTSSPGNIAHVCDAAVKVWRKTAKVPNADAIAKLVRAATLSKERSGDKGGTRNVREQKASARIALILRHVKALGIKKFAPIAGSQLTMIKRGAEEMMKRAVKIEKEAAE